MGETLIVYIDILLFVNAVINSTLLYLTYKILSIKASPLRFVLSVFISTLYGLLICLPEFSFTLNIFIKIAVAFLISFIAFDFKNIYIYGKSLCVFLFVSFSYIALITSFQYMPFADKAFYIQNGEIYYNLPLPYLLIMIMLLFFVQNLISRFYKRRMQSKDILNCELSVLGKNISINCFLDSGNFLKETLSGLPVVIIEISVLKDLLPNDAINYANNDMLFTFLSNDEIFRNRIRLIPYKTAGNGGGMMTGFRPDTFKINQKDVKVIIAINCGVLDKEGRYCGIISREIYN